MFFSDASAPLLVPQPLFFLTSAAPAPLPKPQPLFPLPHFARSTYDSAACATLHHSSFSISHSRSAIFEIFLHEIKHAARVLSRYRGASRTRILRIRLRLTVRVKKGFFSRSVKTRRRTLPVFHDAIAIFPECVLLHILTPDQGTSHFCRVNPQPIKGLP